MVARLHVALKCGEDAAEFVTKLFAAAFVVRVAVLVTALKVRLGVDARGIESRR